MYAALFRDPAAAQGADPLTVCGQVLGVRPAGGFRTLPGASTAAAPRHLPSVFGEECRYHYLVENHGSPATWLRMWTAMLPMARLILVG
jgi:hypothetical protein